MTILGFTTSTDSSSIALFSEGKLLKPFSWTRKEQQSEALTFYIKNYLKKNKVALKDLTLIAVDPGPGSFTGCRIAVNVAKTLAFDLDIPIFSASSLDIMAFGAAQGFLKLTPFTVFCVLDAHRSLFYFRKYQISKTCEIIADRHIQAQSLESIASEIPDQGVAMILGNLNGEHFGFLKSKASVVIPKIKTLHFPQAHHLVSQALKAEKSAFLSWSVVEPSYIRSPDAVEKLLQSK